jgi:hypothetical protein
VSSGSLRAPQTAAAQLYSECSAIAAAIPHAWRRELVPGEVMRNPTETNAMLAFPYTKSATQWNVGTSTTASPARPSPRASLPATTCAGALPLGLEADDAARLQGFFASAQLGFDVRVLVTSQYRI